MSRSERLSYRQVREVAELVGQAVELGRDPTAWRTHALAGLVRLTGARVGLTMDIDGLPGGMPRMLDPIDLGFDENGRRVFYRDYPAVMHEDPGTIALSRIHDKARFMSATRHELIEDGDWYAARAVSELRRTGDVDDFVCTSVEIRPNVLHGFVVYRNWGEPPFGIREKRILRLFQAGILREHARSVVEQPGGAKIETLPPRVRETLDQIVAGKSLKQIAASLQISRHTVNDYTKYLHKKFGVSSRAELLNTMAKMQGHALAFPRRIYLPEAV
jgi:DNA-binding CsgD family transcriptional regulator